MLWPFVCSMHCLQNENSSFQNLHSSVLLLNYFCMVSCSVMELNKSDSKVKPECVVFTCERVLHVLWTSERLWDCLAHSHTQAKIHAHCSGSPEMNASASQKLTKKKKKKKGLDFFITVHDNANNVNLWRFARFCFS